MLLLIYNRLKQLIEIRFYIMMLHFINLYNNKMN